MLFDENKYKFMFEALKLAEIAYEEDEVPIGAVVVKDNRIIGRGYNQVERLNDPTAHAEILAITSAANTLESKQLNECDLYVTVEPCVMCTGAITLSKIENLYFAAYEPKTGACGSLYNIPEENKLNHKVNIYSGIYELEATSILKNYFRIKRNSK
ncbi:MAG: tRNA adenosine(34) deaminase TadA [Melioribacteraceae bacterium]|nr:tRNA adenosine(34) deaminase TadA [Melioribacteraceae bacterium]